jgi:oxaloacetate decarboxylase beta subunit
MNIGEAFNTLWVTTGIMNISLGQIIMILVGFLLLYLAIKKEFEPLLLIPIGFGGILANIPMPGDIGIAQLTELVLGPNGQEIVHKFGGFIGQIYGFGIEGGLFPLFIFIGVGAMTDFGPLIANPKTFLLGAAAQFGIFTTLIGALALSNAFPFLDFSLKDAASIGIIGGERTDRPAIFLASRLSPDLLGAIAVAAYYLHGPRAHHPAAYHEAPHDAEGKGDQDGAAQARVQAREESLPDLRSHGLYLPPSIGHSLIGALMFGNLIRESGVTERLSKTAQNELINLVTIMLGLAVGSKLSADKFLKPDTLAILLLGLVAFSIGTAAGVLLAKLMNRFSKKPINPLIGRPGFQRCPWRPAW